MNTSLWFWYNACCHMRKFGILPTLYLSLVQRAFIFFFKKKIPRPLSLLIFAFFFRVPFL